MADERKIAVAYMRTSSAANVGDDKDSQTRQRAAIQLFADRNGYHIANEFYDAAVSGADPLLNRPGFKALIDWISARGVTTIVVETANRFARDLIVQEVGYGELTKKGITLVAADSPQSFLDETPTATLIRQVLGAVSQFDKAMVVAKLKGARDRKRATGVKVEGRKSHAETSPEMVALARRLYRRNPKTGERRSLRTIARLLAEADFTTAKGRRLGPSSILKMVRRSG